MPKVPGDSMYLTLKPLQGFKWPLRELETGGAAPVQSWVASRGRHGRQQRDHFNANPRSPPCSRGCSDDGRLRGRQRYELVIALAYRRCDECRDAGRVAQRNRGSLYAAACEHESGQLCVRGDRQYSGGPRALPPGVHSPEGFHGQARRRRGRRVATLHHSSTYVGGQIRPLVGTTCRCTRWPRTSECQLERD